MISEWQAIFFIVLASAGFYCAGQLHGRAVMAGKFEEGMKAGQRIHDEIYGSHAANKPHKVSVNPLKHLTDDELVGGQLGTFTGHKNCADCLYLAEHRA